MKRSLKFLMIAAVALISINANAQLGVKVGYVSSTPKVKAEGVTVKPDAFTGFKVGVDYNIALGSAGLSFRPGLNYTWLGGKDTFGDESKNTFHFVNVPLDLKYILPINDNFGIYAVAGPRAVVGLSAKSTYKEDGDKYTINMYTGKWTETYDGETTSGKEDAYMNRFDLQLGLGLGVQYKALSLEFGYDFGMLNMVKANEYVGDGKMTRGQMGITLGYSF